MKNHCTSPKLTFILYYYLDNHIHKNTSRHETTQNNIITVIIHPKDNHQDCHLIERIAIQAIERANCFLMMHRKTKIKSGKKTCLSHCIFRLCNIFVISIKKSLVIS